MTDDRRSYDVLTFEDADVDPLRLLIRGDFVATLDTLRERYDWIIFGAPSPNHHGASAQLAAHFDAVVLVVCAGHTHRGVCAAAQQQLVAAGAPLVGVVLNQRTYPVPEWIYRRV